MSSVRDYINETIEETILFDNLDDCIVGITTNDQVIYDYELLIKHFIVDGMTEEEAVEWIDYNIIGLYAGEKTPVIMYSLKEKQVILG